MGFGLTSSLCIHPPPCSRSQERIPPNFEQFFSQPNIGTFLASLRCGTHVCIRIALRDPSSTAAARVGIPITRGTIRTTQAVMTGRGVVYEHRYASGITTAASRLAIPTYSNEAPGSKSVIRVAIEMATNSKLDSRHLAGFVANHVLHYYSALTRSTAFLKKKKILKSSSLTHMKLP
jgi:hypothetical protein